MTKKIMERPEVYEWADLIARYYRALIEREIPTELVEKLVVDWQIHMLFLVKGDEA